MFKHRLDGGQCADFTAMMVEILRAQTHELVLHAAENQQLIDSSQQFFEMLVIDIANYRGQRWTKRQLLWQNADRRAYFVLHTRL